MSYEMLRRRILTAVLLLLALRVDAGCHSKLYPKRRISDEESHYNHTEAPLLGHHELPEEWNWCSVDGVNYCASSWNQHEPRYCGACWAHGTLSMIQDRIKVRKRAQGPDTMLSRQSLLNCGAYEGFGGGCDGGDVIDVMHYMTKMGLPDESCLTYTATDHTLYNQSLKHCPPEAICRNCMPLPDKSGKEVDTCWAVKSPVLYGLKAYGKVTPAKDGRNEERMMSEIYSRDDFTYKYRGGVWIDRSNSTVEGIDHDVEVVGWGVEGGLKFWHIRNSWGTFWGEMGFFKLQRGVDALFIENGDCWYAEPDFKMENEVLDGDLVGSMWGLVDNRRHTFT